MGASKGARAAAARAAAQDDAKCASPLPAHADLVIVGGGCHAASLLMRLLTKGEVLKDPNPPVEGYRHAPKDVRQHLFKTPFRLEEDIKRSTVVLDCLGGWMLNWQRAYRALDIPHLRSPEGLHPDPYDHSALAVYARQFKLEDEFVEMVELGSDGAHCQRDHNGSCYHGPFQLPTVKLFAMFCDHLIRRYGLESLIYQGEVTELVPLPGGAGFQLHVSRKGGESASMTASNVVLARGPTARKRLPDWASPFLAPDCPAPPFSIAHAWEIIASNGTSGLAPEQQVEASAFANAVKPSDRVVVVGGGLTSAHMVPVLAKRGVRDIKLVLRGPRKVKQFDLTLPWFGDDRWSKRREFEKASVQKKLEAIVGDRDGGSMTPEQNEKLQVLEAAGVCEVIEYTQIKSVAWIGESDGHWCISFDDDTNCEAEKLWLATGARMDAETDPLLQHVLAAHPIDVHKGFPNVGPTLRWAADVPLYVMGGLAALQLGPDAVNLAGGLRGAVRISTELKESLLAQCEAESLN